MSDVQDAGTLVEPKDAGTGAAGVVRRWLTELELAGKSEKTWRERADKVVMRYRGDGRADADRQQSRPDAYNILYANVQTLQPILYNSTPEPVVERRFKDSDPIAKAAGEVLRRAIKYTVSCQDFDEVMLLAVQDYLLPGRSVVSVKYVPTTAKGDEGYDDDADNEKPAGMDVAGTAQQPATNGAGAAYGSAAGATPRGSGSGAGVGAIGPGAASGIGSESGDANLDANARTDEVVYEEIRFDLTPWKSFRRGPGRTWQDVPWIAFELELTREACVDLFGSEIGNAVPLQSMESDDKNQKEALDKETAFKRAKVWQIWDKAERRCLYVCPDYKDKPCKTVDDAYNLSGFFNVPRPMYAVETSDSLVPVSEFTIYQSLADEAETLTNRMSRIARAIRVRGGYAAGLPEIGRILESEENELVPVANADVWADNGGLNNAIWLWPLDKLLQAYEGLQAQRELVKQSIYEILGLSDIMRGATDPQETATAQGIKSRWGSLRTRRRQSEVQRFCRDLMRIAGELIAEKFSAETLAMMTGLWFPTAQEKQYVQATMQQYQQRAQMAQQQPQGPPPGPPQPGQPPQAPAPQQPPPPQIPPEVQQQAQQMLSLPTWEDIVGFLRNDSTRHFRVDIQTDSTIALQDSEDQADYAKMIAGVTQLFTALTPAVQEGILPFDAAKSMMSGLARKFRMGYEIEDQIGQMKAPPPKDPMQDPRVLAAKAAAEAKAQTTMQIEQAKAQATVQAEQARTQADVAIQQHKTQTQAQLSAQKNQLEAMGKRMEMLPAIIIQHLKNVGAITVAEINAGVDIGQAVLDHELAASEQQAAANGGAVPQ
jgi:hypothetical protein